MAASHGGDRPKGAPSPVTRNREDQDNAIARLQVFMLTTRQRCGELFCIRIICEKYVRAAIYKGFNVRGYFLTLTARPGAHKPSELKRTLSTPNCPLILYDIVVSRRFFVAQSHIGMTMVFNTLDVQYLDSTT